MAARAPRLMRQVTHNPADLSQCTPHQLRVCRDGVSGSLGCGLRRGVAVHPRIRGARVQNVITPPNPQGIARMSDS